MYAGQEKTVRTGHGTTDWFQIGKGAHQGCILSPYFFNFCAEYIMRNAGLEEAQAGIKIARRNINNLRYADDTTLMAESGHFIMLAYAHTIISLQSFICTLMSLHFLMHFKVSCRYGHSFLA